MLILSLKTKQAKRLKKEDGVEALTLTPTSDSLAYMGKHKKNQILIGFALETENELEHAKSKLKNKNLDGIVLNSLQDAGSGFGTTTNKISFIDRSLKVSAHPLMSKESCATQIFEQILSL